jgi:hypothetical protein
VPLAIEIASLVTAQNTFCQLHGVMSSARTKFFIRTTSVVIGEARRWLREGGPARCCGLHDLANQVNTVEIIGKGLISQFNHTHPDKPPACHAACPHPQVRPGWVLVVKTTPLASNGT